LDDAFCARRVEESYAEATENAEKKTLVMKHKCPICKAETDSAVHADFPFCSERCRDRDLGNWASEKYVVSEPVFNEEDLAEGEGKNIVLRLDDDLDSPNDPKH
jgi:endogenous inhibitor of DNA gyrase (YacG/DUF329 family)